MFRAILFSILVASSAASISPEPYCDRNETVIVKVPIQRTRQVVVKPSNWKFWKKTTTKTVVDTEHEERVTHKLISACCEGFYMTDLNLCEPICEHGCPAFASCVEPNHCKCTEGYISAISHKDGRPYCEPICQTKCPSGMMCVAPNKCECRVGYRLHEDGSGQCIPACTAGDGCQNGNCVGVEQCACHKNFKWNPSTETCEILSESIESVDEDEEDLLNTSNGDIIETSTMSITTTVFENDDYDEEISSVTECPNGFLLYKGQCRAELFSSSETDCNFGSCGLNQVCLSNGTCACAEDHIPQSSIDGQLSTELVCRHYLLNMNELNEPIANESEMNTTMICLIGLMTICVAVILTMLAVKLLMRRKGRLDVESTTKANLECEYTNKICDSSEWVP